MGATYHALQCSDAGATLRAHMRSLQRPLVLVRPTVHAIATFVFLIMFYPLDLVGGKSRPQKIQVTTGRIPVAPSIMTPGCTIWSREGGGKSVGPCPLGYRDHGLATALRSRTERCTCSVVAWMAM